MMPVPNFVLSDGSYSQERYVAVGTGVCGVSDKALDPIEPRTNNFRL
jgi:hypothetical protein